MSMMVKHTGGEWFYSPEKPAPYGINIASSTGENIAVVHPAESGKEETVVNARLIASAPKMYQALRLAMLSVIPEGSMQYQMAREAIALADGSQS